MFFAHWRNWLRSQPKGSKGSNSKKTRKPGYRLLLETLEDRLTPASHTWTGAALDGLWNTAGNWSGNSQPTIGESNIVLNFGATGAGSITDDIAGQLNIDQINFTASGYTINAAAGSSIGLTGAASPSISDTSGNNTFGATFGIALTGADTIQVSANTDNINGVISGTGELFKAGPGRLLLGNTANTYSGGTEVDGGILIVSADGELGAVPAVEGTNITLNSGTLAFASTFNLNANRDISLGGGNGTIDTSFFSTTVSSVITGAGNLTKVGTGTLTLLSTNTYGNTTINGGTLSVGATGSLAATQTVTINPGATLTGNGSVGNIVAFGGTVSIPSGGSAVLTAASADFSQAGILSTFVTGTNYVAGTNYGQLNLGAGALALSSTSTVNLDLTGLAASGTIQLALYATQPNAFPNVNLLHNPSNFQVTGIGLPGALAITLTDVPQAASFTAVTNENVPVTTGVLSPPTMGLLNTPITVSVVTPPGHGTTVVNANNTVTYTPNLEFVGSDSYQYQIRDNLGQTSTATVSLTINQVNSQPTNTVPAAQTTNEGTALVFSSGTGNAISVADSDGDGAGTSLQVALSVSHGTVSLSGTAGLTFTSGANNSAAMTFNGTQAAVNAALNGLTYNGNLGFAGSDTLVLTSNDLGNTVPLPNTSLVGITVTNVALPGTFTVTNLKDSGPGSLRDAITSANASPGSTINFLPGLTGTINLNSRLNISTGVEIDGPGASVITVSGQNLTSVFVVVPSSIDVVTINDLTIANGKATSATSGEGGGIFDLGGSLNLSDVTFANNRASLQGGALFTDGIAVTVTTCTFSGNRVVAPAGTQGPVRGGAISSINDILTVTGTKFLNNSVVGANQVTAALANEDLGLAEGGAVYTDADSLGDIFTSCTFTGNSARGGRNDSGGSGAYTIGDGQGGAIEVTDGSVVEVDLSTLSSNVAQGGTGVDGAGGGRIGLGQGGAIRVDTSSQLSVKNSAFTSNHALGASLGVGANGTLMNLGQGGAISDEGSTTFLTVAGSTFSGNTAVGGISGFVTGTVINGHLGGEAAGGAIDLGQGASGDISGSTFTSNVALGGNGTGDGAGGVGEGGAIQTFPTSVTISNSQFKNNRAQGGLGGSSGGSGGFAFGGGLFADGGTITLLDLLFSSNRAIGGAGQGTGAVGGTAEGGALDVVFGIVNADNLTVKSNVGQGGTGLNGANGGSAFGGGIEVSDNVTCTIADSLVTLNKALGGLTSGGGSPGGGFGGGIAHTGVLALTNTLVTGNFATTADNDIL